MYLHFLYSSHATKRELSEESYTRKKLCKFVSWANRTEVMDNMVEGKEWMMHREPLLYGSQNQDLFSEYCKAFLQP